MGIPTKGELGNTFLHFFINNGQRYIGLPGIYHTKIDNNIFDAIRATVTESDIPASERGETDRRFYGVEIVSADEMAAKIWTGTSIEYENQPEGSHNTDTMARSFQATNGQVYRNAAAITALQDNVNELRRMLGVLLGWNPPGPGTPEPEALAKLQNVPPAPAPAPVPVPTPAPPAPAPAPAPDKGCK